MIAEQLDLVGRRAVDERLAVLDGEVGNGVEAELPLGMLERDDVVDRRIDGDDQPLAAGDLERQMAGRVAGRVERPDSGHDVVAGLEHRHPVLDGCELALRALDEVPHLGRHLADEVGIHPEVPFGGTRHSRWRWGKAARRSRRSCPRCDRDVRA